jgi:uncharacterized membrane protein YdjX (TVP38/TMEM64 family)
MTLSPYWRLALLAVTLAAVFVVTRATGWTPGVDEVQEWGDGLGAAGPPAFVVLGTALSCILVPFPLLCGAAGALFGVAGGTLVAVVMCVACAVTQMSITRALGAPPVAIEGRRAALDGFLTERGALKVFYARLVPLVPFVPVNYAAGTTALLRRDMALGTGVAGAPRCFAYAALGGSISNLGRPEAKIAIAVLVAMGVIGLLSARYRLRE